MIFIEFSPQPISKLSDKTYPDFPLKIDFSAFSILYLSPLNSNQPPGLGYRPLIFPIIFKLLRTVQQVEQVEMLIHHRQIFSREHGSL